MVGNLPYNISTPLLFHLIESAPAIIDLHVMLQREVIARMAAAPGEGAYGRLTVMINPWVDVESLFEVGPGAFQPPPRVWSAVARVTVRPAPRFAVHPRYAAVVAGAFAHRRKTLRNALRGQVTPQQIERCGIDPSARPETLAPEMFNALAEVCEPGTIVIAAGTVNDVRLYRDLVASGIHDYLLKPFTVDQLRDSFVHAQTILSGPRGAAQAASSSPTSESSGRSSRSARGVPDRSANASFV